jgi:hypothetical protein
MWAFTVPAEAWGAGEAPTTNTRATIVPASRCFPTSTAFLYSGAMPKKIQIRPPGLKPTTKVGTLGPYRGRLGLAWVIAPLIAGVFIIVAGYFALFR